MTPYETRKKYESKGIQFTVFRPDENNSIDTRIEFKAYVSESEYSMVLGVDYATTPEHPTLATINIEYSCNMYNCNDDKWEYKDSSGAISLLDKKITLEELIIRIKAFLEEINAGISTIKEATNHYDVLFRNLYSLKSDVTIMCNLNIIVQAIKNAVHGIPNDQGVVDLHMFNPDVVTKLKMKMYDSVVNTIIHRIPFYMTKYNSHVQQFPYATYITFTRIAENVT